MHRPENPDAYYDKVLEREKARAWWRVALRYFIRVVSLIAVLVMVLTMYWMWQDYSAENYRGITWENFVQRAEFRWQEFLHGRLGLEQCTDC